MVINDLVDGAPGLSMAISASNSAINVRKFKLYCLGDIKNNNNNACPDRISGFARWNGGSFEWFGISMSVNITHLFCIFCPAGVASITAGGV